MFVSICKTAQNPAFGMSSTNICDTHCCLKNTMLGIIGWPTIEKVYNFEDLIVLEMSMDITLLGSMGRGSQPRKLCLPVPKGGQQQMKACVGVEGIWII